MRLCALSYHILRSVNGLFMLNSGKKKKNVLVSDQNCSMTRSFEAILAAETPVGSSARCVHFIPNINAAGGTAPRNHEVKRRADEKSRQMPAPGVMWAAYLPGVTLIRAAMDSAMPRHMSMLT